MVYNRKKERVTIMEQKELFARVFGAAGASGKSE